MGAVVTWHRLYAWTAAVWLAAVALIAVQTGETAPIAGGMFAAALVCGYRLSARLGR